MREIIVLSKKNPHTFSKPTVIPQTLQIHQLNNDRIFGKGPSDPRFELLWLYWISPSLRLKISSSMNWPESDSLISPDCKRMTLPWPPGLTTGTDLSLSAGRLNLLDRR